MHVICHATRVKGYTQFLTSALATVRHRHICHQYAVQQIVYITHFLVFQHYRDHSILNGSDQLRKEACYAILGKTLPFIIHAFTVTGYQILHNSTFSLKLEKFFTRYIVCKPITVVMCYSFQFNCSLFS